MCRKHERILAAMGAGGLVAMPVAPPFGSGGLMAIQFTGDGLDHPILGSSTGKRYPFHKRPVVYVDQSDAVFILSDEFIEIEL